MGTLISSNVIHCNQASSFYLSFLSIYMYQYKEVPQTDLLISWAISNTTQVPIINAESKLSTWTASVTNTSRSTAISVTSSRSSSRHSNCSGLSMYVRGPLSVRGGGFCYVIRQQSRYITQHNNRTHQQNYHDAILDRHSRNTRSTSWYP